MRLSAAEQFILNAEEHDGASVNAYNETPEVGYMVSFDKDAEAKYGDLTPNIIEDYFYRHHEALRDRDVFVGAWLNDGVWYLDLSLNTASFEEAHVIGKIAKQKAIYNLDTQQGILL